MKDNVGLVCNREGPRLAPDLYIQNLHTNIYLFVDQKKKKNIDVVSYSYQIKKSTEFVTEIIFIHLLHCKLLQLLYLIL